MDVYDFAAHEVAFDKNYNRIVRAKDGSFHLSFDYKTGLTVKFGHSLEEDPTHCPFGPEIADIEITTKCSGIRQEDDTRIPCPWCYKSNTFNGQVPAEAVLNTSYEQKDWFQILSTERKAALYESTLR